MARRENNLEKWDKWFAWYPVQLLGTPRYAWLRSISRRYVSDEKNQVKPNYSDTPVEHPAGYGLRGYDIK
jgi:hypothetical protein